MRIYESEVEFNEVMLRCEIETLLGERLDEWDREGEFELSMAIESPGPHGAELCVHIWENMVYVTIWLYLADLLALTGPRMSPSPHQTELGEHGDRYETYRNHIVWAITTELGLRSDLTEQDAIYGGEEAHALTDQSESVVGVICEDYDGADDMFGPDLTKRVPYSVAFRSDAFCELDGLTGYAE